MWTCSKCNEAIEDQFESCWKCSTDKGSVVVEKSPSTSQKKSPAWQVRFKIFRGTLATWDELFTEAAQFATDVGPERLINISHSANGSDGVVTVWYLESVAE